MTREQLASALKKLRQEAGLTGETVARRSGMSAGKLSKLENGKRALTVQDVDRILTALRVSQEIKKGFLQVTRLAAAEEVSEACGRRAGSLRRSVLPRR